MKCVLLFSLYYPPTSSAESQRSGCMAKYIPRYGWDPMVVAGQTPSHLFTDDGYVCNLPLDRLAAEIPYDSKGTLATLVHWEGLVRLFRLGFYPAKWIKGAMRILPRIFSTNQIDAIWATYPSAGAHYLANYCSFKFGIPWIADFRDFPGEHGLPEKLVERFRIYREIFEIKKLVRSAAAVTAVSKGLANVLEQEIHKDVQIIMNGFDPEDMDDNHNNVFMKFNLVFIGSVYKEMSPRPILDALAMLLESGRLSEEDLDVSFYCKNYSQLVTEIGGYPYRHLVNIYPPVMREKCDKICRSSVILMLPGLNRPGLVTSRIFTNLVRGEPPPLKTFIYLAAQRPILAGPGVNDCTQEILRETNAGVVCSSVQAIAEAIWKWYQEWKKTGTVKYTGRKEAIMKYSRERQAGQLAELLDNICPPHITT